MVEYLLSLRQNQKRKFAQNQCAKSRGEEKCNKWISTLKICFGLDLREY